MIIIGLGNPGIEYEKTRHNVGFMFVDYLQKKLEASEFESHKKSESEISQVQHHGNNLYLVKPQTFMNRSGEATRKLMDFYKIPLSELVIVHDDLDIDFGRFKIQTGVGPKVHNGINNIEEHMNSKEFVRVRIGINDPRVRDEGYSGESFVLQRFTDAEVSQLIKTVFSAISNQLFRSSAQGV